MTLDSNVKCEFQEFGESDVEFSDIEDIDEEEFKAGDIFPLEFLELEKITLK